MKPATIRKALRKRRLDYERLSKHAASQASAIRKLENEYETLKMNYDKLIRIENVANYAEPHIWAITVRIDKTRLDAAKSREGIIMSAARFIAHQLAQ